MTTRYSASPDKSKRGCPFALDLSPQSLRNSFQTSNGRKESKGFNRSQSFNPGISEKVYPVKIENISKTTEPEQLQQLLAQCGEVPNVYIPRNLKTREAARDFAIVRFRNGEAAEKALELNASPSRDRLLEGRELIIKPLEKQISTFSGFTGSLGITNEIPDHELMAAREPKKPCEQNISLDECFSRSGYPWGSKQELKVLEPHAPRATLEMHAIHLSNLNRSTTRETLEAIFETYGKVGSVYFPKPLQVQMRVSDANCGAGYVRYTDKRDADTALQFLTAGKIIVDGNVLSGAYNQPMHWPTEQSRRYY